MTNTQMDYFCQVYTEGNIAVAAEKLFVSRSVVSRAISDLEQEFETVLFLRSHSGVVPTEAGKQVYNLIRFINSSYASTKRHLQQLSEPKNEPSIRVGVTPTNCLRIYRTFLRNYIHTHPESAIIIVEQSTPDGIRSFANGELDVIFTNGAPPVSDAFDSAEVYHDRIVLAVPQISPLSQTHTLGIVDILDCPIGTLCAPIPKSTLFDDCFAAFSKKPNIVVQTSSMALLQEMTETGHCCALLPEEAIKDWNGVVPVPLSFMQKSPAYMVWNKAIPHTPTFWDLISYVKAQL